MNGRRSGSVGSLAILAALTLAICVTLHGNAQPRTASCTGPNCRVIVSIVECGHISCKAQVDIDELNVQGNNVRWELTEDALKSGYEFQPVYGVWFKTWGGQRDFECKIDGKMFKCMTKVQTPTGQRYPYGVQIIGPKSVPLLDPWIVN
jgi:hypothetical protein